jgi:tRNA A37 threonylcarbamoyladenosine dehydratase
VIGLGGVGSWVCEGLIRSGINKLTIIDFDDICISNINRQLHAMTSTIGKFKVDELRRRMIDINPHAEINVIYDFIREDNIWQVIQPNVVNNNISDNIDVIGERRFDCIIDAVDGVADKAVKLCIILYYITLYIILFITGYNQLLC